MHGNLLGKGVIGPGDRHQHPDPAQPVGHRVVDIGRHMLARHRRHPAQVQVLADGGHGFLDHGLHRLAVQVGGLERLKVVTAQRHAGHVMHQPLEIGVAPDEIGFRVHLDRNPAPARHGDAHQPLGGDAVGLLGGLGQALGAQPVDRCLHVAVGFDQRLLRVHHACAGAVAQFFHHLCGDGHLGVS